jgi:ATP-dependent protease ClpP protease subunit
MPQAVTERKFKVVFNAASADQQPEAVVDIFEDISDWWGWGVNRLARALYGHTGPIRVRVNSYGGDLLQGMAIMNLLRSHPGEVTVEVMGIAASAATFIVAGANKVLMREGSFLMIHNPWTGVLGEASDLENTADSLRKMQDEMVSVYLSGMKKRKKAGSDDAATRATIQDWMDKETWMTSEEAVNNGFADEVLSGYAADTETAIQSAAASHDTSTMYQNTPQRVLNLISANKNTPDMAIESKGILEQIKNLLNPPASTEAPAVETPAEQVDTAASDESAEEADPIEAARQVLESAGYTVTDAAENSANPPAKTYTEEEVMGMITQAVASNKAAASNPVPKATAPKPQAGANRADTIRANAAAKFDGFAQLVRAKN